MESRVLFVTAGGPRSDRCLALSDRRIVGRSGLDLKLC